MNRPLYLTDHRYRHNINSQYGKFAARPPISDVDKFIVLMYFKWFGVNVCIAANEI